MDRSSERPLTGLEILATGRHLRLVRRKGWEFVERPGITGIAVIAAVTDSGEILLIEQYREAVEGVVIELPAGLAGDEPGMSHESLATAAMRELEEETGFQAEKMEELFTGPPSAGLSSELLTFFFASGLARKGPGGGVPGESITVHAVPLHSATEWLFERQRTGSRIDPKVFTGLFLAERKCNS